MCATLGEQEAQKWHLGAGEQAALQVDATAEGPGSLVPVAPMDNPPGRSKLSASTPLSCGTAGPLLPGHPYMHHGCTAGGM